MATHEPSWLTRIGPEANILPQASTPGDSGSQEKIACYSDEESMILKLLRLVVVTAVGSYTVSITAPALRPARSAALYWSVESFDLVTCVTCVSVTKAPAPKAVSVHFEAPLPSESLLHQELFSKDQGRVFRVRRGAYLTRAPPLA